MIGEVAHPRKIESAKMERKNTGETKVDKNDMKSEDNKGRYQLRTRKVGDNGYG